MDALIETLGTNTNLFKRENPYALFLEAEKITLKEILCKNTPLYIALLQGK